jgi:phosphoribosyl 1,2-cyclic phosphodiesterase
MFIKIFGCRGSIPVANRETCKYGGNTTCLYVESRTGDAIIIDAGSGIRELGGYLMQHRKEKLTMILTHYHWDHLQGFPFFVPVYMKSTKISIHGAAKESSAKKALSYQMSFPYFPTITLNDLPAQFKFRELKKVLKVGSIRIQTMDMNHPNHTKGLRFTEGGKTLVFMTDNELFYPKNRAKYRSFVKFARGANILIHDAAYSDEIYPKKIGWGHSTYTQVMQLAKDSGVRHVVFTHHDPPTSDDFIDDILKKYRQAHPRYTIEAAADGKTYNL